MSSTFIDYSKSLSDRASDVATIGGGKIPVAEAISKYIGRADLMNQAVDAYNNGGLPEFYSNIQKNLHETGVSVTEHEAIMMTTRIGLAIGAKEHAYLEKYGNSDFQENLRSAKIYDAINDNNYVGITVKFDSSNEVFLSGRGSANALDWVTNATIGAREYIADIPVLETQTANAFALKAYELANESNSKLVLSGHSQDGYQVQQQAAFLEKSFTGAYKNMEVHTFNSPQAGEYIRTTYGDDNLSKISSITTNYSIDGDLVHLIGHPVGKELTYYTTTEGNFLQDHSMSLFVTPDASTFNAEGLIVGGRYATDSAGNPVYGEPVLNVEGWTNAYAKILSQEESARTAINNMGVDGDVTQVTRLISTASGYLYGKVDQATLGVLGLEGNYIQLNNVLAQKQGMQNIASKMNFEATFDYSIESTKDFIAESVGGQENLELLNSIADVVFNSLDSKLIQRGIGNIVEIGTSLFQSAENLDSSGKESFITSLKDNPLIKNIMDSTFGIQSDNLVDIADNLADINRSSQQAQVFRGDPLTFDLDGDGIETLSVDEGVLFDHEAKDVREGTGWISSDDGLLVRDIDGNGTIDSGRELFGDNTLKADGTKAAHGFEALSELDSNADGVFDVNDTEFENLQVWQDTNSDGISQANELKDLSQVGVSSIDLSHQSINRATDGGVISDIGTFIKTDGASADIGNLFLDKEPARSEFTDEIAISGEILSTGIDIRGIGAVRVYI